MKLSVGKEVVMAIGDLHYPFAHTDHLDFLKAVKKLYKPTQIVCMGDELDVAAISNYDPNPDGYSPGQEIEAALKEMDKLYAVFPQVKVCTSNHTARPYKRASKVGIPSMFLKSYAEWLQAPKGWSWHDNIEIDGVLYNHGEGYSGRNAAIDFAKENRQSGVIGHIHSFAGIQFTANQKTLIWGMNVGCLIDVDQYAFLYAKHSKAKPVLGVGIVDRGVPIFIPMVLDAKNGRWTGKL